MYRQMKQFFYLIIFLTWASTSCNNNEKTDIENLAEKKEDGSQEVKVDALSVEDVEKLMNDAASQGQTYTAILNNDTEKTYPLAADTNQKITWVLESNLPNAKLLVYKESITSVKKDSGDYIKIKDFKLVCDKDSCTQLDKKKTNYKAVVRLNPKFSALDSTCEFTLRILKNQ
jgi:hypothetical protein